MLLDVLEAEEIDETEGVVVAGVELIVGADAAGIAMGVSGGVVVLALDAWGPREVGDEEADLDDGGASVERVTRIGAALEVSGEADVEAGREGAGGKDAWGDLDLTAIGACVAEDARRCADEEEGLDVDVRDECGCGGDGAMEGEACAVLVESGLMVTTEVLKRSM